MIDKKNGYRSLTLSQAAPCSYTKEVLGVTLGGAMLYVLAALVSYHETDSSFFYFSSQPEVTRNWAGGLGAELSALVFFLFGIAAYLLVAMFCLYAYLLFFNYPLKQERLRFFAFVTSLVSACALCALFNCDPVASPAGGLLGYFLQTHGIALLGEQGSIIFFGAVLWISLTTVCRFPLLGIVRWAWHQAVVGMCLMALACKQLVSRVFSLYRLLDRRGDAIDQEVAAAGGAQKDNDDFFDLLDDEGCSIDERVVAAGGDEAVLLDHAVRRTSDFFKFLHVKIVRLPNSRFARSAYLSTHGKKGESWHEVVVREAEKAKKKMPNYLLPEVTYFTAPLPPQDALRVQEEGAARGHKLEEKLLHFGIKGKVTAIKPGPVITLFEYSPEIDSKISKIIALEDDLALALTAHSIRIIAPIPGRNVVGFEIANQERLDIFIAQPMSSAAFTQTTARLPLVLGVDVIGVPVVVDLVSMPHLLVGGATGSGKSVGLGTMLVSLLCKLRPDELKLILVDPKRLEFTPYADVPHLLFPIVTQPTDAARCLKWVVQEMEKRYQILAETGVRNILEYQKLVGRGGKAGGPELKPMPFMVVMIDELADLMMVAARDVETSIIRIAQMARAAGIHLIVATQRPSVDVVTGLIKANFPSRIAFRVSSKVDSRTILDAPGAEKLLGRGDMLFMSSASPDLKRVHGAFMSDREIETLVDYVRSQAKPEYLDLNDVCSRQQAERPAEPEDELYDVVVEFVKKNDEISISMLQRQYRIGFNRSARLIEKLELDGLIAPAQGSKPRKVLR
jgi:S-DNA-T family DNA segregation ATPase FtsK/SpoIIIE